MSYIKAALLPEEQLLYYTKPHYIVIGRILVLIALSFLVSKWIANTWFSGWMLVIILVSFIGAIIDYSCSEYALTNKRVLMKMGVLSKLSPSLVLGI